MKICKNCKWLDRTKIIYWEGMFNNFYNCKKQEMEQTAINNREGIKRVIFSPSYLDTDERQHGLMTCLDDISKETKFYFNELPFEE